MELYLEGSDQHRGWFHSSLLMSEALYERAPYRGVLTHGFTVDEKGRKMSKSLGNVIAPQKVMNSLGADVLRLWVAATDYANEIAVSDEILKRMADSYRRMRNTLRFLLGNLHGFDPAQHALPVGELVALDRWVLARTRALQAEITDAYRRYAFHLIYQKVHNFCTVDLGGLYLDVIKDRLYTTAGGRCRAPLGADGRCSTSPRAWCAGSRPSCPSPPRRCGATCPASGPSRCSTPPGIELPEAPADAIDWEALLGLRADVTRELEKLRDTGAIGAPLEARVEVYCTSAAYPRSAALGHGAALPAHHLARRRARVRRAAAAGGAGAERRRQRGVDRAWRRRRSRSACAAGSAAPTSVRTAATRSCAGAASATSRDRASGGSLCE